MASRTYTTPGTYPFTWPVGVETISVECWGAGGGGAGAGVLTSGRGGGGGGAYAWTAKLTKPAGALTVVVGERGFGGSDTPVPAATRGGASLFMADDEGVVKAAGGGEGYFLSTGPLGGYGGSKDDCEGEDTIYSGGKGGDIDRGPLVIGVGIYKTGGGGGGSSASTKHSGNDAVLVTGNTGTVGAPAPTGGGHGGNGGSNGASGDSGSYPGGGGGGAGYGGPSSGNGADGKVIIEWSPLVVVALPPIVPITSPGGGIVAPVFTSSTTGFGSG